MRVPCGSPPCQMCRMSRSSRHRTICLSAAKPSPQNAHARGGCDDAQAALLHSSRSPTHSSSNSTPAVASTAQTATSHHSEFIGRTKSTSPVFWVQHTGSVPDSWARSARAAQCDQRGHWQRSGVSVQPRPFAWQAALNSASTFESVCRQHAVLGQRGSTGITFTADWGEMSKMKIWKIAVVRLVSDEKRAVRVAATAILCVCKAWRGARTGTATRRIRNSTKRIGCRWFCFAQYDTVSIRADFVCSIRVPRHG